MSREKPRRWPFAYFMNIVNVAGVAAFVLWRNITNKSNEPVGHQRDHFLENLATQMVYDQIKRRSTKGLNASALQAMSLLTGIENEQPSTSTDSTPRLQRKSRCHMCPSVINRKQKQVCDMCKRNVCKQHAIAILRCKLCLKQPILNSSDSE